MGTLLFPHSQVHSELEWYKLFGMDKIKVNMLCVVNQSQRQIFSSLHSMGRQLKYWHNPIYCLKQISKPYTFVLTLNHHQWLICHKTKQWLICHKTKPNQTIVTLLKKPDLWQYIELWKKQLISRTSFHEPVALNAMSKYWVRFES